MKPQLAKPKIIIKCHKEGKNVRAILDVNRSTTVWHEFFVGSNFCDFCSFSILGDPGADSGGEGKSKQAEKYGTKEK